MAQNGVQRHSMTLAPSWLPENASTVIGIPPYTTGRCHLRRAVTSRNVLRGKFKSVRRLSSEYKSLDFFFTEKWAPFCNQMDRQRRTLTLTFLASLCLVFVDKAAGIRCYQCISTNNTHPFQCNEFLSSDIDIEPEPCDNVFGAQYCVKHVGRFEAASLDCYQCASADEWQCMDGNLVTSNLLPVNCSHVYDAQYCVKTIGRYGGGIGTKRFCSAVHEGNYCDYVKQPGDKLTYRTCVFTCTGDGCNTGTSIRRSLFSWLVLIAPLSSALSII